MEISSSSEIEVGGEEATVFNVTVTVDSLADPAIAGLALTATIFEPVTSEPHSPVTEVTLRPTEFIVAGSGLALTSGDGGDESDSDLELSSTSSDNSAADLPGDRAAAENGGGGGGEETMVSGGKC